MNKYTVFLAKMPDTIFSWIYLHLAQEKPSLIVFTLHSLFQDEMEKNLHHIDPQLGITLHHFEEFISYFKTCGYQFISPKDIQNGLNPAKHYVMITFDDGYYNNIQALPYLKKYNIPASFFISIDHMLQQKCFWWDVHYRERKKQGYSILQILKEQDTLKSLSNDDIEKTLISWFGKDALIPLSNIDRPFLKKELKTFSQNPQVFIGNHTKDHSILTNLSEKDIANQIIKTQQVLKEITGTSPLMISYPNGNYSDKIIGVSEKTGLKIGFTTDEIKNYLPFKNNASIKTLHRFDLTENDVISRQCMLARSEIVLYRKINNLIKRNY